jgi:hypothetical protein
MNLFESLSNFFSNEKKPSQDEVVVDTAITSFATPSDLDGAAVVEGGVVRTDFDSSVSVANEPELIRRYRAAAKTPEISMAIDEICNEAITEDDEGDTVKLDLEELELSDALKKKISEEFKILLRKLEFKHKGMDYFRRWYVDGRIYFHKVVDTKKPKEGIQELRYINPTVIKKVVEIEKSKGPNGVEVNKVSKEYYTYTPGKKANNTITLADDPTKRNAAVSSNWSMVGGNQMQVVAVAPEAIAYCSSGLYDEEFNTVLSYLHPAMKVANQLATLEDSLVIYRLSRAPERRVFYVGVGNMPKPKAEQYMRDLMAKFKNTLVYDSLTGEIKDGRRHVSMLEDYWIPRTGDGKTTEISTLPSGTALNQLDDVQYFLDKLYKSLNVPIGRIQQQNGPTIAGLGRTSEITRDEVKFQKFIDRLRNKFSILLLDILKTQLVLKNIVSEEDWKEFGFLIEVEWSKDNFYTEMKEIEILRERIQTIQMMDPYIDKLFTKEQVLKKVMRYTEDEIKDLAKKLPGFAGIWQSGMPAGTPAPGIDPSQTQQGGAWPSDDQFGGQQDQQEQQ